MKKFFKILTVIILLVVAGAWWYWQNYKKSIIKDIVRNAISNSSDSLYFIQYDSSMVDEVNGNAYFRNIYLQSDSAQERTLKGTDSLPNAIYNIFIQSITAEGIDMPSALQSQVLHARKIIIDGPRIQIIQTGANQFKLEDTIALYKKIVGQYKSIYADSIILKNGTFIVRNRFEEKLVTMDQANILMTKFKVDSTRDYSNVLSYFIDNLEAGVGKIWVKRNKNQGSIELSDVKYNSNKRTLMIKKVTSSSRDLKTGYIELNQLLLEEMNVKAFIAQHRIQTGKLSCAGGIVTIYTSPKDTSGKKSLNRKLFEFPDEFFDEIEIGSVNVGNSTLIIRSKLDPGKEPLTINNVKFSVSNETSMLEGNTLQHLINQAKWKLTADGFAFATKNKQYDISLQGLYLDRNTSAVGIRKFIVKPRMTEAEFVKHSVKQGDYYQISISDILLSGVNFNKFIQDGIVEADAAKLKADLRVYNDRRLPVNTSSKVGKYPHQLLKDIKIPLLIRKIIIENSSMSYRERAKATEEVGDVFFTQANGTLLHVSNIPAYNLQHPLCVMDITGLLLGKGKATTHWEFMMNSKDGAFSLNGKMGPMDLTALNSLAIPLGMMSMSGQQDQFSFSMNGNDLRASGSLTFLYHDMKVKTFSVDDKTKIMKKKKLESWLGNELVINSNPAGGKTRTSTFSSERELNKSFFNLIWKSIFNGMEKTIFGEGGAKIKNKIKKKK